MMYRARPKNKESQDHALTRGTAMTRKSILSVYHILRTQELGGRGPMEDELMELSSWDLRTV